MKPELVNTPSELQPTELHRTERFVLRRFKVDDIAAFAQYRNDPSTAEYQTWPLPYTLERAAENINGTISRQGPENEQWFAYAIADPVTDRLIGDIAVRLECDGRSAMLGYNLAPEFRRQRITIDAAHWVIGHLFTDYNVTRVHASLHPDNIASMMLLEQLGFIYEGTLRQSFWVEDTCTDDPQFGLLASDWQQWNSRNRKKPAKVELVAVSATNRRAVYNLATHYSQQRFVAPMGVSAMDALVPGPDDHGGTLVPWFRAVVADDEIVGFVMVADATATNPHPFLWRLLIDRMHQRRGIGTKVLDRLVEHFRANANTRLLVSWAPGPGSPEPLYLGYGFVPTDEVDGDELVGSLAL
jgi:RimJ/RimL family protein N-acetyltransferase